MRRTLFLICILMSLSFLTLAQKKFCDGYIITLKDDTIRGIVRDNFPFRIALAAKKISFIDASGIEKKYLPDDIKGYSKGGIANYISLDFGFGKDFARIVVDGEVTLLSFESINRNSTFVPVSGLSGGISGGGTWSNSTSTTESLYLYNRRTNSTTGVNLLGFKSLMAAYFSDYIELKEMIENKELEYSDLEIIVEKYNRWKSKNKPSL